MSVAVVVVQQSHILKNNAVTIVNRAKEGRDKMDLHLKEERYPVSTKDNNLLGQAEAAEAAIKSTLEAQKAAEKKNDEPWYFTHF